MGYNTHYVDLERGEIMSVAVGEHVECHKELEINADTEEKCLECVKGQLKNVLSMMFKSGRKIEFYKDLTKETFCTNPKEESKMYIDEKRLLENRLKKVDTEIEKRQPSIDDQIKVLEAKLKGLKNKKNKGKENG